MVRESIRRSAPDQPADKESSSDSAEKREGEQEHGTTVIETEHEQGTPAIEGVVNATRHSSREAREGDRMRRRVRFGEAFLIRRFPAGKHADDLATDRRGVRVEVEQDPCRYAFVLADNPQQDVLGSDVTVL